MKNTFDIIDNIINKKEQYSISPDDDFVPYMIQRWISMISPEMAYVINETSNTHFAAMQDKQMWNDYFLTTIPKIGRKKIKYLKKDKPKHSQDIKDLAQMMEISCRELCELLELTNEKIKKEKTVEVFRKTS